MVLSIYLAIFTTTLAFLVILRQKSQQNAKLPPGPVGVPILGYLPFMDVFHLGPAFKKIGEKFGNVFSLKVGTELAVVLNSYESIKKAFAQEELCSRPNTFMFRFFSHGENGIASASGEKWKVQSKFALTQFKKLGLGKSKMENHMADEIDQLIENLEQASENGTKPVEIGFSINVAIVNVMWAMLTGERKSQNDPTLMGLLKAVNRCIELATTSGILLFMPFLIKILPECIFGITEMRKLMKKTYGYLQKVIQEHKENLESEEEESKDFIDAFLKEMKKPDKHQSFNEFQLQVLCSELFGAGGEPTAVTLKWAIRYLAKYPEIQKKAQAELDSITHGNSRKISLSDRQNLPYFQALIMDLIRISDIHPIGVLHSPSQDTQIEGYWVPKGTFVIPNFHKVHHDPQYWEKPDELYPEHWLHHGEFVSKHEGFLSFGTGKRRCPGHDIALMELFMFLSRLMQRFTFELAPGDEGQVESTAGCVVSPKPYMINLIPRH